MKEIFLKFILCKKIERQELKFLNLKYVFLQLFFSLRQLDIFFCSMKSFLICSPPLLNNCKVLFMTHLVQEMRYG
ncbi:Uncharacterised protein [Raoultella planticola]|uniref:Uncharacterized protein n=1 Tax=Raoultella planticola TaxID=575 RepID=A0A8G2A4P8_RAOPL|nr:hypothetical protein HR38_27980 [Klebsiella michiganensis]OAZ78703.1 hypothetical protein AYO05_27300 [Raoultella planticola]OAZ80328.1 hypothetical protein AYO04_25135 [Raoultella planticola]SAQ14921.1 Uncharacterised protein [Raoultella planticola]